MKVCFFVFLIFNLINFLIAAVLASIVVKDKKDCWIGDKSLYAPVINEPTIGINELLFEYRLDEKIMNNKNNKMLKVTVDVIKKITQKRRKII